MTQGHADAAGGQYTRIVAFLARAVEAVDTSPVGWRIPSTTNEEDARTRQRRPSPTSRGAQGARRPAAGGAASLQSTGPPAAWPWYESAVADDATDALLRASLFSDLDPTEIGLLAGSMRRRIFRAGDVVTVEGEGADGFFVIERGEAEVAVQGQLRGRVGPGDFFGEIALLMGTERTATITAA